MPSKSIASKRKRLEDIAFKKFKKFHQEINRLDFTNITLCTFFSNHEQYILIDFMVNIVL